MSWEPALQTVLLSAQWGCKSLSFLSRPWEGWGWPNQVFPNQAAEDKAHGQGGPWEGVPGWAGSPRGKHSGSSCVSCVGKVGQSPGQGALPHPRQGLRWSSCVAGWGVFFRWWGGVPLCARQAAFSKVKNELLNKWGCVGAASCGGCCYASGSVRKCPCVRLSQHSRQCHTVGQDGPARLSQMKRCHLLASTGVHGDGWNTPLHHMAALTRAETPWRGSCGYKWGIICWLIVLSFRDSFKVTWLRSSTSIWVGLIHC